jgi:hypothetical protein
MENVLILMFGLFAVSLVFVVGEVLAKYLEWE